MALGAYGGRALSRRPVLRRRGVAVGVWHHPNTVTDVSQLSEKLLDLVFRALDHATESIAHGGPLVPFVLAETATRDRSFERFVADDVQAAEAMARERITQLEADATRAALAYGGHVTIGGHRSDAVLVQAQERGKTASVIFAQRYQPGSQVRKLQPTCNAAFLGDGDPLF
jgi:hypothetical protein